MDLKDIFLDTAAFLYEVIAGTDTPKPPKKRNRPRITHSDIEFMENYIGLSNSVLISQASRYKRLKNQTLMMHAPGYLSHEGYRLTSQGWEIIWAWRKSREPMTRIKGPLSKLAA